MMRILSRAMIIRSLIVCGLFAQGATLGTLYILWDGKQELSADIEASPNHQPAVTGSKSRPPLADEVVAQKRELGERLLINGQPYPAMRNLLVVANHLGDNIDDLLRFELAVCYEAARDLKTARDLYSQISEQQVPGQSVIADAARFAMARTAWIDGDRRLAIQTLWKKVFAADSQFDLSIHGDIVHMAAQVISEEATCGANHQLTDERSFVSIPLEFRPEREVQRLRQLLSQEFPAPLETVAEPTLQIGQILKVDSDPEAMLMDLQSRESSVMRILELLSQSTDIAFEITDRALALAHNRYVNLTAEGASLALILDRITLPYELCWAESDQSIVIGVAEEMDRGRVDATWKAASRRLLNKAILEFPDSERVDHSIFNLAIVNASSDRVEEAAEALLNLMDTSNNPVVRQHGFFNLSRIYRRINQFDLSEDSMQKVIESAAVGPVLTIAFLEVGKLQLGRGDLESSIQSFTKALRVSNRPRNSQIGAVQLASAYLLNNDPRLARLVLIETKKYFSEEPITQYGRYLSALAAFRESNQNQNFNVDRGNGSRESIVNLMASLPKVQPVDQLGAHQHLLIAQGWSAIDATTEVTRIVNEGLAVPSSEYIRDALTFELATSLINENRIALARKVLASVSYSAEKPQSLAQLLVWAKLEYQMEDFQKSEQYCQELLGFELDENTLAETLRLMGMIKRKYGEHNLAVLYFAGFRPE